MCIYPLPQKILTETRKLRDLEKKADYLEFCFDGFLLNYKSNFADGL